MELPDFFHIIFQRIRCIYKLQIIYITRNIIGNIHIGLLIIAENPLQITVVC